MTYLTAELLLAPFRYQGNKQEAIPLHDCSTDLYVHNPTKLSKNGIRFNLVRPKKLYIFFFSLGGGYVPGPYILHNQLWYQAFVGSCHSNSHKKNSFNPHNHVSF